MAARFPDDDFENPLWSKDGSGLYIDIFRTYVDSRDVEFYDREVAALFTTRQTKNNAKAAHCRRMGSEAFKQGNYQKALEKFNEAVCYSENGSLQIAIPYACRSAYFLKMELYQECLNDTKIIESSAYPANLRELLYWHKEQSKRHLKMVRVDKQKARLSYKGRQHAQYPGVSECLKLDWSSEWGHHVTTTRDLKINKTVMIEKPFSFVGHACNDTKYYRCSHCYKSLMNLIPCTECVSAMFCDDKCMAAAKESRHKYECKLAKMGTAKCECTDKQLLLVLDFLWKVNMAFDTVEDLIQSIESFISGRGSNSSRSKFRTNDPKKHIETILKLETNKEKVGEADFLQRLMPFSIKSYSFVMRMPEFNERFVTDAQKLFLKHFIVHLVHIARVSTNLSDFNLDVRKYQEAELRDFAIGLYPVGTFLNHSCVPNVYVYCVDNRLICKVIRPIAKGEQLFRSYICGVTIINDNPNDAYIRSTYNFLLSEFKFGIRTCKCKNCVQIRGGHRFAHPLTESKDEDFDKIELVMISKINDFFTLNKEERERLEDRAVAYLNKFESKDPSEDKCKVQIFLHIYWQITTAQG